MINYEEFQKIDLRVGKIIEAEKIENSEKLLKLKVDLGEEVRQIIAGIGREYKPEELLGKELAVVVNLEPKNLMGFESQGMILAAASKDGPVILIPEKEIEAGDKIK